MLLLLLLYLYIHLLPVAQYDALTCAGGFAESHLLPAALWEMVKLTRPGGYIVNVMREADRRDCAFYRFVLIYILFLWMHFYE